MNPIRTRTRLVLAFVTTLTGVVATALLGGCGATSLPPVRFADAPAVVVVNDRRDTPAPAPRPFGRSLYHFRGNFLRPLTRSLELPRPQRALGVNALDEVPDSTWFTNRIGVRALSLDELRAGPATVGSPEAHRPWTVKSTKIGGASLGFVIEDARGERFVLKFDLRGFDEIETAADAIVGRILWAAGYNVPEDHVVYFRAGDLRLAPDAKVKDVFGNARPLRQRELEEMLAQVVTDERGQIRGLASRWLDGTWLGGHPAEGVRRDDPNDRIPHELRRDLRGARAIFSWLDHTDVKEDNTLDMWVVDPETSTHYVKHYLLDFGKAMGAMAVIDGDRRRGRAYVADVGEIVASLASVGLNRRSWEDRGRPELRGVGLFEPLYDPGAWKPLTPSYLPFLVADRYDQFWGARIIMRFTRAQLEALVETGRLTDPRSAAYLVDTLVARQRVTARYWFSRVSPIDDIAVTDVPDGGHALCFDDLLLRYRLAPVEGVTRYRVTTFDRDGRALGPARELRPVPGRTCTGRLAVDTGGAPYTMVRIQTLRPGFDGSTYVHLAGRRPRVIGIWRQ